MIGGKGDTSDGAGDARRRKGPPFSRRSHRVTHTSAREMRKRYEAKYAKKPGALAAGAYGRKIFEKILAQPGCLGVRFYPGLDDDGNVTLLFCGVNKEGNDILIGLIGDLPWRCPPFCSGQNGVLQF